MSGVRPLVVVKGHPPTDVGLAYHNYTIARVAGMLGEAEDWPWDVANEMDHEDGLIWVYGPGDDGVMAFTAFDIETLTGIIETTRQSRSAQAINRSGMTTLRPTPHAYLISCTLLSGFGTGLLGAAAGLYLGRSGDPQICFDEYQWNRECSGGRNAG
jgi:hypothetical protein